jgi:hypothetical protein
VISRRDAPVRHTKCATKHICALPDMEFLLPLAAASCPPPRDKTIGDQALAWHPSIKDRPLKGLIKPR